MTRYVHGFNKRRYCSISGLPCHGVSCFRDGDCAYGPTGAAKVDDIDLLLNLLAAVADSVDNMSDEEVQAELIEEDDISKRGFGQR
jgi:hypothetical protein